MEGLIIPIVLLIALAIASPFLLWNAATDDYRYKPCDSYSVWEYNQKLVPMRCEK